MTVTRFYHYYTDTQYYHITSIFTAFMIEGAMRYHAP